MDRTIRITGLKECVEALQQLSKSKAKAIVRKGLREGAKIIQATERSFAPVDTGLLQKSIGISGAAGAQGTIAFAVSPKRSRFKGYYYAPVVIYGRSKSAPFEGRDFVLRAFETKHVQAAQVAADYIEQHLDI